MTAIGEMGNSTNLAFALGSAVLHFLWQGALIGLLAGAALLAMRRGSAHARYLAGCAALVIALVTFVATFAIALETQRDPATIKSIVDGAAAPLAGAFDFGDPAPYLPGVAWLWMLGACTMIARLALQWMRARRLKCSAVDEVDDRWKATFRALCRELGVTTKVKLMRSGIAQVPMVIGWLTPVVLVPVSAFTSLSPDQLRSILAHEIAHIRRHDYLINGLQAIVECVLFFHPVVWWLSGRVRAEREHCCDDAAVGATGDAVTYARALSALETLRTEPGRLALSSKGGSLMNRISRIVGLEVDDRRTRRGCGFASVLVAIVCLALMGFTSVGAQSIGDDDFAAVWAKLQAMVKAGELTPEQAKAKMATIKKGAGKQKSDWNKKAGQHFAATWAKLQAMVNAGKITREQAHAKMDAIKKKAYAKKKHDGDHLKKKAGRDFAAIWAKLQAAVKAGKLSPEDAKSKMAAYKKGAGKKKAAWKKDAGTDFKAIWAKLQAAVKAGKLSPEDAKAKMAAYKKGAAKKKRAKKKTGFHTKKAGTRYGKVWAKLEAMVKAGALTAEEAKAMMAALKKKVATKHW